MEDLELFKRLGLALAIGLLLGVERGWHSRDQPEGQRVAGVRTFALTGFLGGVAAVLGLVAGDIVLAAAFLLFAALLIAAWVSRPRDADDWGTTTEVAQLLTFALGALAVRGDMDLAAAGGVVVLALLSMKEKLHLWIGALREIELVAAVKLLLISVVMLPLLPNQGYGPGDVLNPYELWLLVVLIAAISFVGYFAIKLAGARTGAMLTGLFGGLASSTALTVGFSRMGKNSQTIQPLLTAGVTLAAGVMFLRVLLLVFVLNQDLLVPLAMTLVPMAAVCFVGALVLWMGRRGDADAGEMPLDNPFDLATALKFGVFLAVVLIIAYYAKQWLGDAGLYALGAISGIADVDAITLSMARMAQTPEFHEAAVGAIFLASAVNTLSKGAMVQILCGGTMAKRTWMVFVPSLLAGGVGVFFVFFS